MRKIERLDRPTYVVTERTCNRCDGPMIPNPEHVPDAPGYGLHVDYSAGDGSLLRDRCGYHFDLCETCLCWLMDTFKHPPMIVIREYPEGLNLKGYTEHFAAYEVRRIHAIANNLPIPKYEGWHPPADEKETT